MLSTQTLANFNSVDCSNVYNNEGRKVSRRQRIMMSAREDEEQQDKEDEETIVYAKKTGY